MEVIFIVLISLLINGVLILTLPKLIKYENEREALAEAKHFLYSEKNIKDFDLNAYFNIEIQADKQERLVA